MVSMCNDSLSKNKQAVSDQEDSADGQLLMLRTVEYICMVAEAFSRTLIEHNEALRIAGKPHEAGDELSCIRKQLENQEQHDTEQA